MHVVGIGIGIVDMRELWLPTTSRSVKAMLLSVL